MKHTLHCSSSAFVSFISRSTAAAVNPSACQQQEQQPLRECWTSPFSGGCSVCLEPCYSSLKARRCWKVIADVIEHWWLWPFGFFFFLLFFVSALPYSFHYFSHSLPEISHHGPLVTHGLLPLARQSMAWALRRCTEPCRARTPQFLWSSKTAMVRWASYFTKFTFEIEILIWTVGWL